MTIQFQKISYIEECDFDNLFLESIDGFNKNFPNPLLHTYEDKKTFYKNQLESAILQTSPLKKSGETFLMFKVVLDGKDVMVKAGYIEEDGITHRGHWFLTATDSNQSRNWMYTEEFDIAQREFYAQFGVTQHKVLTYVGADLYRMMKSRTYYVQSRGLTGRAIVIDEQPMHTIPIENSLEFVVLTVQL